MTDTNPLHCFPATAPAITITPLDQQLGPIDCQELQWWFAVPRLGDRTAYAAYNVDTGDLDWTRHVVATAPAPTYGERAIELRFSERTRAAAGKSPSPEAGSRSGQVLMHRFTCVLDHDHARWLEVDLDTGAGGDALTPADSGFNAAWGTTGPRCLIDSGRYQPVADGSYRLTDAPDFGAGVYRVGIGTNVFTCRRVIDLPAADESQELNVAFVEQGGRTVLYRQYRGRGMDRDWQAWRDAHPDREFTVDDCLFLQRNCSGEAHDVLTSASFDTTRAEHAPSGDTA